MRKSPIVKALFPGVRGRILAATLTQPEKPWYLSELSEYLHTQPSSLQREVNALAKVGILAQWKDGRRVYLKPDRHSPVYPDLQRLFAKTEGLIPVLQQALKPLDSRMALAFVYGSVARSQETSASDIDLLTVGSAGLSDLVQPLRKAEKALGRPVNATVFTPQEFSRRVRQRDHFLTTVLAAPKLFVKGDANELELLLGSR